MDEVAKLATWAGSDPVDWESVRELVVPFGEMPSFTLTDAIGRRDVAAVLAATEESFEREWYRTAVDVFPEWRDSGENFDVALDLVHYVMDGMAVSFPAHEHGEHEKRLLAYLEKQMHELSSRKITRA
jgi:hypothetical protein